ncbi:MAG TPA: TonB-dependent receptor [Steroidobacteraceae bacterium]|nr:TonB-dependent receptor [Steroidobacteraceae bacterium]
MITHPHSSSAASGRLLRLLRSTALTALAAGMCAPFPQGAAAADAITTGAEVTGTHIRGSTDSAFPITVYNRDVIAASGASTLQEFIQKIPQNFNGGASETTMNSTSGGGGTANVVDATGVNLRGLGNDSSLVLVNGHRVAPGNTEGNFVDISMIPLYAVERVEVVTDGASAIYGSDAVGGVVNIILGRNLDGAETRARYGSVTDGATKEKQVGQTLGHSWDSGSAQLIYEYLDRTPLSASSRSYTQSASEPFMLLPEQVRHGAFFSADQSVGDDIQLLAEGTYSHRSTYNDRTTFDATQRTTSIIDAYSASTGARIDLPRGAQLELTGSYTGSDTRYAFVPAGTTVPEFQERAKSQTLSVDVKMDGRAFSLPAGDVRYAVGAQFRREEFDHTDQISMNEFDPSRRVEAAFAEFRVPLAGPRDGVSAAHQLELTLADRMEHYSDFGYTNNPQVGLIWRPFEGLKARATYGTSFRAPLLNDLNPVPFEVVPIPESDPGTGGVMNTLAVFGGNPDLKPEKARTWTVGLDFTPRAAPDFRASVTYYQIRFTDVITDPEFSVDVTDVLSEEALLGPSIIQRNPSAERVQQLAATPGFTNLFGIDLSTIGAIFDSRVHNLSIERTQGLDLDGAWTAQTAAANVELGLNGTYIFRFQTQFTPNASTVSILNTAYNPVDLRMRARAIIRRGGLTLASFVNFTDSYHGDGVTSAANIPSWTTIDATAKYLFNSEHGPLADASVMLTVTNLFDKSPPLVANPIYGINFDGANANALGRFISIELSKRW